MDINQAVRNLRGDPDAVLLDVRTEPEYRAGHIPGGIHLPLQSLDNVEEIVENKDTPLYVYCRSGARSRQAALVLQCLGYTNVTNIGGMAAYTGKVEV